MSKNWILVELSDDKTELSLKHGDAFMKGQTDFAMSSFYRALATFAERSTTAQTEESRAEIEQNFRTSIDQLIRNLRM